jgi:hypothetical protein
MTTQFKQKASEYNMYQLENLPNEALDCNHFKSRLDWYKERFNKVEIPLGLLSIKEIEVGVFAEVREQYKNNSDDIELYYIDNYYILVFFGGQVLRLQENRGKYSINPMFKDINILTKNTNYYQRQPFIDKLKEPNQIGVFTFKKINDWFNYSNDYLKSLKDCNEHIFGKKSENQKVIDATIKALPNAKVSTYQNRTDIYCKLFDICFELLDNGAYLKQQIIYKGGLENVLKIENNIQ